MPSDPTHDSPASAPCDSGLEEAGQQESERATKTAQSLSVSVPSEETAVASRGRVAGQGIRWGESTKQVQRMLGEVLQGSERGGKQQLGAQEVDAAVQAMLEEMFDNNEDLSQAQYMVAAVQFKMPWLKSHRQQLMPLTRQSFQGWRKLDPPKSRLPLPWEVVCLIALK